MVGLSIRTADDTCPKEVIETCGSPKLWSALKDLIFRMVAENPTLGRTSDSR